MGKAITTIIIFMTISILAFFIVSCTPSTPTLIYKNPEFDISKYKKIVVLPFKNAIVEGKMQEGSGEIVSSIFETTLLSSGKFTVIERMQLEKIIKEQQLSSSWLIEEPVSMGKLVKADIVVVGSVTTWYKAGWGSGYTTVGASIKAVSVETGITLWSIDKSSSATYFTDGIPVNSTCDIVAKKLCREMIEDLLGK
jgi:curli biogenesis system outer membrane secretion channel CsgG